jgi:hypothetical protein
MDPIQPAPVEATFSRRRLLLNSAKITAGAAAFLGTGVATEPMPVPAELPRVTEEIAGHWTTF